MNYLEERAKLTAERDGKEREICLSCASTANCKGVCDHYTELIREIRQEYKDKFAELKARRPKKAHRQSCGN